MKSSKSLSENQSTKQNQLLLQEKANISWLGNFPFDHQRQANMES